MSDMNAKRKNLSKDQFLALALEALTHAGHSKLRLESLIEAMPVSRGSFYHHFKDRHEFMVAISRYWHETHTQAFLDYVENDAGQLDPMERLQTLYRAIYDFRLVRVEAVMRSLAFENEEIAKILLETDTERLKFLRATFAGMGFEGDDLEARARGFLTVVCTQDFVAARVPEDRLEQHRQAVFDFFTRP